MTRKFILLCCLGAALTGLASCKGGSNTPGEVIGYAPVYQSDSTMANIRSDAPQPILRGGKIYVRDKTMYQVEEGSGIHIIDITRPENPARTAFIHVSGAQELSIKGDLLYTNNYNDLVVLNISNPQSVREVQRMKDMFHITGGNVPPEKGYFECINPDRGSVIGWQKKTLYSPKCKY